MLSESIVVQKSIYGCQNMFTFTFHLQDNVVLSAPICNTCNNAIPGEGMGQENNCIFAYYLIYLTLH